MDFFEHQDVARKRSGRLVLLFILAVIAIIALVYVVVAIFMAWASGGDPEAPAARFWRPELLVLVGGGTLLLVAGGSAFKISSLRGGGRVVADALGGRLVDQSTRDHDERRVLNVVEEMAIASGVPVPPVYMMDQEQGINAFAAGYAPDDAVIGVTRGCVQQLRRAELQGVMAHEFSHILNGDMRLNIRIIGVLHGILVIGLLGSVVLRSAMYGSAFRSRRDKDSNPLPLILLGAALMAIGYVGVFFGNVIKAAVSRQREYLADASAVQFTRDPSGISGALQRIGGFATGSRVENPRSAEISHLFFGQAFTSALNSLFATHPPLVERIRRIDPSFEGQFTHRPESAPRRRDSAGTAAVSSLAGGGTEAAPARPSAAIASVGQPTDAHLRYAAALIEGLPDAIRDAAHEAYGARALVYALLLDETDECRKRQVEQLRAHADPNVLKETARLHPQVRRIDRAARLTLADMVMAALREMSPDQYQQFRKNVAALIRADEKIDLFEWALHRMILRHLEPHYRKVRPARTKYYSLRPLVQETSLLIATLACCGHEQEDEARAAFEAATGGLGVDPLEMPAREACTLGALDEALGTLETVGPREKRKLLTACATCVGADQKVTVEEGELLRAVSDALGCPMPPLLPGQSLV